MAVKIFFCYAHEDETLLKKLKTHLRSLQRQGVIDIWHDRDITAGTEWEDEIRKQLNSSQIILLLISPDFMDSEYCYSNEMRQAIDRHERGEARVIPVILHHVYWKVKPLNKLQALPRDGKPLMSASWHSLNEALLNVVEGIDQAIKDFSENTVSGDDGISQHDGFLQENQHWSNNKSRGRVPEGKDKGKRIGEALMVRYDKLVKIFNRIADTNSSRDHVTEYNGPRKLDRWLR